MFKGHDWYYHSLLPRLGWQELPNFTSLTPGTQPPSERWGIIPLRLPPTSSILGPTFHFIQLGDMTEHCKLPSWLRWTLSDKCTLVLLDIEKVEQLSWHWYFWSTCILFNKFSNLATHFIPRVPEVWDVQYHQPVVPMDTKSLADYCRDSRSHFVWNSRHQHGNLEILGWWVCLRAQSQSRGLKTAPSCS